MSENHSENNRRRWAKIPLNARSQIMKLTGKSRWAKTTKADRLAFGRRLTESRLKIKR